MASARVEKRSEKNDETHHFCREEEAIIAQKSEAEPGNRCNHARDADATQHTGEDAGPTDDSRSIIADDGQAHDGYGRQTFFVF